MGATKKLACDVAGISGETMYDWEDKFPDFAEAVTKAMGRRGVEALTDIRKAGRSGNWTASAWYLERTQPGYQLRRDENVGGWSDGEIQQALADLMAAQAKALDKQP